MAIDGGSCSCQRPRSCGKGLWCRSNKSPTDVSVGSDLGKSSRATPPRGEEPEADDTRMQPLTKQVGKDTCKAREGPFISTTHFNNKATQSAPHTC